MSNISLKFLLLTLALVGSFRPFLRPRCKLVLADDVRSSENEEAKRGKYSDHEIDIENLDDGLRYYREYVKRGMKRFMAHDLEGAESDFERAREFNNSQPLMQRGVVLYINGKYDEAEIQFKEDTKKLENLNLQKASDFRIWWAACLYKSGKTEQALQALDLRNEQSHTLREDKYLMNNTLHFFGRERSLDEMMSIIGNVDSKDMMGHSFFGNFYLGLYFDAINDPDMAKLFMEIPYNSNRYSQNDMWYHLPRIFYEKRKWNNS